MYQTKTIKSIFILLMISTMLSVPIFAEQDEFTQKEKFKALIEAGIFEEGNEPNSGTLDHNMSRAQTAKVVALVLGEDFQFPLTGSSSYTDVNTSTYAAQHIQRLTEAGYLNGFGDGTFRPDDNITVEQLAKVLVSILDPLGIHDVDAIVDGSVSDWAAEFVAVAINKGLIQEADDYKGPATREILVESLYATSVAIQNTVTEDEGSPISDEDPLASDETQDMAKLFLSPIPNLTSNDGTTVRVPLELSGEFKVPLAFSDHGLPPGATLVNLAGMAFILGTPFTEGSYHVTITAIDDDGNQSTQSFSWIVEEWIVPEPSPIVDTNLPIITLLSSPTAEEGESIAVSSNVSGNIYLVYTEIFGKAEYGTIGIDEHSIGATTLARLASEEHDKVKESFIDVDSIGETRFFDTLGLAFGTYYLYATDTDDRISTPVAVEVIDSVE